MTTTSVSRMLYVYPWDLAVRANQQRYPTHERVPILKSSEILLDETYYSQADLDLLLADKQKDVVDNTVPYHDGQDCELFPEGEAPKQLERPPELLPPSDTVALAITAVGAPSRDSGDDAKTPIIPRVGVRRIVRRVRLQTPAVVKTALRMSEMVVRHESWIDIKRRELRIVTRNESWANTAMVGDVTVYRGISDTSALRGKVPVAPMGTDHKFVGPIAAAAAAATTTTSISGHCGQQQQLPLTMKTKQEQGEWCLFQQYAYFKISPTFSIPFRSTIEAKCLQCYQSNTQEGRKLDIEFMQQQAAAL
ncbi:hypothetical protein BDB00DRAFT_804514 [Zychaea mexicana]|uniref:uncharacterized protein n=1 Tax=Zychaea mexicana TaxID=64656 RepID=UPI0022FE5F46|nr:uncharacterized protein BDB00DRAFT_804514 [Zychaea mexicana]KAI9497460.1 hypothetical protein BDB00DRAFT_804514 [Zychaea mexicana]